MTMTDQPHTTAAREGGIDPAQRMRGERFLEAASDIDLAILHTLGRVGRLLNRHLHTLWMNGCTTQTVANHTRRLRREGLLARARCSVAVAPISNYAPPKHVGYLHVLSALGEQLLADRFPQNNFLLEKIVTQGRGSLLHQAEHQIEYADLVMGILRTLMDVPGFVGVSSASEIRLGPLLSPRSDGFLLLRRWNNAVRGGTRRTTQWYNPWLITRKEPGQSDLAYAIEIDRDTEAPSIIRGKAQDYRRVFQSGYWVGRYYWPIPLWVVPDDHRKAEVVREWTHGFPESPLMITTKRELDTYGVDDAIWETHHDGTTYRRRVISDDWRRPVLHKPNPDSHPEQTTVVPA